jgi:hypothetical protein
MKARLVYWHKAQLQSRYVLEMSIYEVAKSAKYKDGVRYRLILVDVETQRKVLMDNHYPKEHHVHLDKTEIPYEFVNEERLIEDFKRLVLEHLEVRI